MDTQKNLTQRISNLEEMISKVLSMLSSSGDDGPVEMNIRQAAALVGYSVGHFRRLTHAGHVPHFQQGNRLRYDRAKLLAWKAKGCPQNGGHNQPWDRREILKQA